jgi:hypothetical protein
MEMSREEWERKSLAILGFMRDIDELRKINDNPSIDNLLKDETVQRFANICQSEVYALENEIERIKKIFRERLNSQPNGNVEEIKKSIIKKYVMPNGAVNSVIADLITTLTGKEAGNLELALLTNGKAFNLSQLVSRYKLDTAKGMIEEAVKKIGTKEGSDMLPAVVKNNQVSVYQTQYPYIPSDIVITLFDKILQEYLENNFTKDGKKINHSIYLPMSKDSKKEKDSAFKNAVKYAAIGLTTVGLGLLGLSFFSNSEKKSKEDAPIVKPLEEITTEEIVKDNYKAKISEKSMVVSPYEGSASVQFEYNKGTPSEAEKNKFHSLLKEILEDSYNHYKSKCGKNIPNFEDNIMITFNWGTSRSPDGDEKINRQLSKETELATEDLVYETTDKQGFRRNQIRITRSSIPESINPEDKEYLTGRGKKLGLTFEEYIARYNESGQRRFKSNQKECEECQKILKKTRRSFIESIRIEYNGN